MAITASEARRKLFPLIEQVNNHLTPVEITSKRGDTVLIAIADYRALEETAHLLRSPERAKTPRELGPGPLRQHATHSVACRASPDWLAEHPTPIKQTPR